jgi:ribosomal protein S13
MLPASIKNIYKQENCSETTQPNQNPLYRSVRGLPARGQKTKHKNARNNIAYPLADHPGTGRGRKARPRQF